MKGEKPPGYVFGRPTKYRAEMCERVIEMGKQGMSKCEMSCNLDIDYTTFEEWSKTNADFSNAVNAALKHSQAWWEKRGREATFDSSGFSAPSYIFQMKNRFKADWSDTTTLAGDKDKPLSIKNAGVDEILAELKSVEERLGIKRPD